MVSACRSQASATIDATALNAAKLVNAKGSIYKAYAVNCLPMRHILEQEHITHVNLWALGEMLTVFLHVYLSI